MGNVRVVSDFLPSPEELALKDETIKVTIALSKASVDFFNKVPGFNFHGLQGMPKRYSIHVNGPWCITFEWEEGEVLRVNLE